MKKDKWLLLGSEKSIKHVGESTKAGKTFVWLIIMYALALTAVAIAWGFQ